MDKTKGNKQAVNPNLQSRRLKEKQKLYQDESESEENFAVIQLKLILIVAEGK